MNRPPSPVVQLLSQELEEENAIWMKLGLDVTQMHTDTMALASQLHALIEYVIENEIVDRDDLDTRFLNLLIKRKKETRGMIMKQMAQSKILGPDGKPVT